MGFTKREATLALAITIVGIFLGSIAVGAVLGFVSGEIKMTQAQFDGIWQFGLLFGGAALMYFGFRAGQSNGSTVPQS